jgi:hypothetical protein
VSLTVAFDGELFLWDGGEGSWHFVRVPAGVAADIDDAAPGPRRGFGSLKVQARIGETSWATSIFPEKQEEGGRSYVLPVKKAVRDREGIMADDVVRVELEIVEGEGDR